MRSRSVLLGIVFMCAFVALPIEAHAAVPYFGPIVPDSLSSCPGAFSGLMVVVNNLISILITFVIAFIAPLVIAYAGFLLVTQGSNPKQRHHARMMIQNMVIGIIVAMGAYMLIAAVMAALYDEKNVGQTWESLVYGNGGPICLDVNTTVLHQAQGTTERSGAGTTQDVGVVGGGLNPSANATGICTPAGLQEAGLSPNLAATMSCITKYENRSCALGQKSYTDIGADGNSVSWGIFQINISANDLNTPKCMALHENQPLNCTKAFANGAYTAKNHATRVQNDELYRACVRAASNAACNAEAAQAIYQRQGIGAWGTDARRNCST